MVGTEVEEEKGAEGEEMDVGEMMSDVDMAILDETNEIIAKNNGQMKKTTNRDKATFVCGSGIQNDETGIETESERQTDIHE